MVLNTASFPDVSLAEKVVGAQEGGGGEERGKKARRLAENVFKMGEYSMAGHYAIFEK